MRHYQVYLSQLYMAKKILLFLAVALGLVVLTPFGASAISTFQVTQGGTGNSTLSSSQLLYGAGTNPVKSVATTTATCSGSASCTAFTVIGTSPITISASAGSGAFPFTVQGYGNSTSSVIAFLNGLTSNGSTTITSVGSGLVGANNGLLYGFASSSLFGYTPLNPTRNINTTWPILGGGDLSADRTLTFGGLSTSTGLTTNSIPLITGVNTFGNSSLSQSAGTTYINGTTGIIDGGGNWIGDIIQSAKSTGAPSLIIQPTSTSSLIAGNLVQAGGIRQITINTTITPAQFCGTGEIVVASTTASDVTVTLPSRSWIQSYANGNPTGACSTTAWPSSFAQQILFNNSPFKVMQNATDTSIVFVYAPGTPSTLPPGQSWLITGQLSNEYDFPQGFGGTNSQLRVYVSSYSTTGPIFASSTNIGIGTSSPFAKLAIHGNPTDATLATMLFAVGSSTASATTTLFTISNTGAATANQATSTFLGLTNNNIKSCNTASALTTDTLGNIGCGAISGSGTAPGGSNGQFQFNNSSSFGGIANSTFHNTGGWLSFGTSTLTVSASPALSIFGTSTAPQLLLTDNSNTNNDWFMRAINGNFYIGTSSPATFATSTMPFLTFFTNAAGITNIGIGSSTPSEGLVVANGGILNPEIKPATSTAISLSLASSTQQLLQIGTAAVTVTLSNAMPGQAERIPVCNSATAASTVTWASTPANVILWNGGTAPVHTTTANKCDLYTFTVSQGTSTSVSTPIIMGSAILNY